MRIVCISDTHDMVPLDTPEGDVLIHAGDLTIRGDLPAISRVGKELMALPFKHKLVIAGNHDALFEKDNGLARMALRDGQAGIRYLQDSSWGYREPGLGSPLVAFWGSPWTPRFYDWAFQLENKRPEEDRPFLLNPQKGVHKLALGPLRIAAEHWKSIPAGIDVLITHGPPKGILDLVHHGQRVGDPDLLVAVDRVRPKLHVFGHIHSSPGVVEQDGTVFVNAAICDEAYRSIRKPIVLDYEDGVVTIISR